MKEFKYKLGDKVMYFDEHERVIPGIILARRKSFWRWNIYAIKARSYGISEVEESHIYTDTMPIQEVERLQKEEY